MEFNACTKHIVVRNVVRDFAEAELRPIASDIDRAARFPHDVIDKMKKLSYFGLQAPPEFGGADLDTISYCIVIEELSRVCAAVGLCVTVHNSVGLYPILKFGTPEQKKRFVPDLVSGKRIGAFCITEANAGSDAGGVETTAAPTRNGYLLNGTKIFVTNGGVCGLALIFAVTELAGSPKKQTNIFMVESERKGFSVGEIEDLCGVRANPVSSLFLEEVKLPAENLLGKPGQGFKIGLTALDTGRLGIAAQALGLAQGAFEASVKYSRERQQFGQPISNFQTIQNYLAEMETEIDAARLLLYRAAAIKDAGRPFTSESAKAKLYCATVASKVTNLAVQIHGGYGYTKEYEIERYLRDAKVTEIYEGTSEVQKLVIARHILSRPV